MKKINNFLKIKNPDTGAFEALPGVVSGSGNASTNVDIVNLIYPVGSIYMSASSENPSLLFCGTWEQITERFLLAASDVESGSPDYIGGDVGGEAMHTLIVEEIPAHTHTHPNGGHTWNWGDSKATLCETVGGIAGSAPSNNRLSSHQDDNALTETTGGDLAHNNMPPYLVVYIWKRTA